MNHTRRYFRLGIVVLSVSAALLSSGCTPQENAPAQTDDAVSVAERPQGHHDDGDQRRGPPTTSGPALRVAGRVTDAATGAGIPGIGVALLTAPASSSDGPSESVESRSANTNEAGGFAFYDLKPGAYVVWPRPQGTGFLPVGNKGTVVELRPGESQEHVRFSLERGAKVDGTVTDAHGLAVKGVHVTAVSLETLAGPDLTGVIDPDALSAVSGDDGAFQIIGLPYDTPYRLRAKADGWSISASEVFTAERGQPAAKVGVVMRTGSRISGTARRADGKPAARCEMTLFPSLGENMAGVFAEPKSTTTDDRGTFAFEQVSAGKYLIQVPTGPAHITTGKTAGQAYIDVDGANDITELVVSLPVPAEPARQ